MSEEKLEFQAEVSKLLNIVAHSLYSHKEIFLRELISNASDACDKLRYEALTDSDLIKGDPDFAITLSVDEKAKTLTIADNGIGMRKDELIENLGTIARSGTGAFVDQLTGDSKKDMALIGQFGVGFYSSFMVADKVDVVSKRAGSDEAWRWTSDGQGAYTISDAERDGRGTTITLTLNKEGKEFLEEARIRTVVKTYSDHIALPIKLGEETLNTASALWTRPKKDITDEQYKEFYHHVAHQFDDPWMTLHNTVEGVIEYTNLLFIPSSRPFDIFHPERKQHVKLYVKRVFITDDCEELLPSYLRFVKGVVDAQDLSLNISREMLQKDAVVAKIRSGLTKRILGELKKKAEKKPDEFAAFWETFGAVFKEGIYEDFANREKLVEIARFKSTTADGWTSLDDYIERMKDGQKHIYYITGDDLDALSKSPQLEGFKAKGVEVLLLTDPVDEFWVPSYGPYKDKEFHSVTRGGVDLDEVKKTDAKDKTDEESKEDDKPSNIDSLIAAFKLALGETVKDVRKSDRLTDSAVCLVADENDMDMRLQRMLAQQEKGMGLMPRVLEVNPDHPLIRKLTEIADKNASDAFLVDAAQLLLDQARIIEGEKLPDPSAFAKRMTAVLAKGISL